MSQDCLIRRSWALAAAVAVGMLTGCAVRQYVEPLAEAVPDPAPSPASAHRSFEPMVATYENTAIVAWSTRFAFVDLPNQCDPGRPIIEPLIFLGNVCALPVAFIIEPPFVRQHAWRPVGLAPTQTAAVAHDDVYVVTEGAIVPAPRHSAPTPPKTTKRNARTDPDDEWNELIPVRTPRGVVLVEPGAEPMPEPPPPQPAPSEPPSTQP